MDGGAVRVHRGSEASQLAESFDARAFTHEGQIYLPQSHGPLSGTKARSLLAHEITHVTQQRRLGSGLPSEDSPHGQQLEAQAVAAESGTRLPLAVSGDKGKVEIQPDEIILVRRLGTRADLGVQRLAGPQRIGRNPARRCRKRHLQQPR